MTVGDSLMLKLEGLKVAYGAVEALHGIDLEVRRGELVSILGANGAGKSTTLMAVSGLVKPKSGRIIFYTDDGRQEYLENLRSHQVVGLGVIQVPEGRRVFGPMTVEENLKLGAFSRKKWSEDDLKKVYQLFPRLEERRHQMSGTLSGGEQQMLAIGRALMAAPKLLLLDEPSLGLAPMLVKSIFKAIKEINLSGVTVILVEQNARAALKLANRAYVLDVGSVVLTGCAEALLTDEKVREFYLGTR
ncbi:MAG: ABC transporter ATP-binding protein [Deltaproteobacteria bacterium]|jgi:branched-chain amino acid transport system ATP-binding protein|nr:ABC transporter ATP-binding protein [Deltaproteobacteria bacterium]